MEKDLNHPENWATILVLILCFFILIYVENFQMYKAIYNFSVLLRTGSNKRILISFEAILETVLPNFVCYTIFKTNFKPIYNFL